MLGERFATRLNSFAAKPHIFWKNQISSLKTENLIERAGTVNGLTDLDLNYPDHVKDDFDKTLKVIEDNL